MATSVTTYDYINTRMVVGVGPCVLYRTNKGYAVSTYTGDKGACVTSEFATKSEAVAFRQSIRAQ